MRILHVLASSRGGAARHVLELNRELVSRGFEIGVVLPFDGGVGREEFLAAGIKVFNVDLSGHFPAGVFSLRRFFSGYDVLHLHGTRAAFWGRIALIFGRRNVKKVVYTYHGLHFIHYSFLKKKAAIFIEKILNKFVDIVIALSGEDLADIKRLKLAGRVELIPNGVSPIEKIVKEEARRRLGLPLNKKIIGFIGRLHPPKDVALLIEALTLLLPDGYFLLIVGDGPDYLRLRELAEESLAAEDIKFLGDVASDKINEIYGAIDLLVLPTLWEGSPLVVLEAFSAGVPVVASDVRGVREVVGDIGILVPLRDAHALARGIKEILDDRNIEARKNLVAKAFIRWQAHYTAERMVEQTIKTYKTP